MCNCEMQCFLHSLPSNLYQHLKLKIEISFTCCAFIVFWLKMAPAVSKLVFSLLGVGVPTCYSLIIGKCPNMIQCSAVKDLLQGATGDCHLEKEIHKNKLAPVLDNLAAQRKFNAMVTDSLTMWTAGKGHNMCWQSGSFSF